MGIFQSDLTIKTAIELGMDDMRKELWLLDDALSDAIENPYLKDKYGQKQIDAFKEWFVNNQIDIVMRDRNDKDKMPCVSITLGNSTEKDEMKTMADQSTESVQLLPQQINKPIGYVVKPFAFISYDDTTGEVVIPADLPNLAGVSAGMILVNPDNGQGYIIQDVVGGAIVIEEDLDIGTPTRLAVVPQHQFYTARREHTFFQETYSITCHAHGDPQTLLWLWTIVTYTLLRYRESMFEAQGFTQSSLSSSSMNSDGYYTTAGGEQVWTRTITLSGMVENSWIKSPRRIIEFIALREKKGGGYRGGIKILSNSEPDIVNEQLVNWLAVDQNDTEDDE